MKIYRITGFQGVDVPHWSVAYIEADDENDARMRLGARLVGERPDTVGEPTPDSEWEIVEANQPLVFVLGGWCR